jgi:hypothetical protein
MERFFTTETGPSAAMRQLGENFLRGATGERSLQDVGAKIDGAEAETDRGLPPGGFARFVDGANAFYRDPANAKYKGLHDTAFCQRLAAKYENVMTREEEYYYANAFGARFYRQIMQPKEYCADPEWPRLHPAVEECIAETRGKPSGEALFRVPAAGVVAPWIRPSARLSTLDSQPHESGQVSTYTDNRRGQYQHTMLASLYKRLDDSLLKE